MITKGKKGASLIQGEKIIRVPASKVKAIEETGAGDAFGSGLIAGLIKWGDVEKALKLGVVNGGSVAEHFGPKEGLLFEPEISKWMKD